MQISDHGGRLARLCMAGIVVMAATALLAPGATALVAKVKPVKIGTPQLKQGTATVPYKQQLTASGGTAPYTFSLQEGSLPAGITLSPSGELSGTPTEAGSSTFTVLATDSSNPAMTATRTYTIGVQLYVEPGSIRRTSVSALVEARLNAVGGSGSYEYSVVAGALPKGIHLYTEFPPPKLYGSTETAGDYTFTIQALDTSTGAIGTRTYKLHVDLTVNPAYTSYLQDGFVGEPYNQWFQAEGGSRKYTYAITRGALPEGLELTPNGELEASLVGTPAKAERATFTITATDVESGRTGKRTYHMRVLANHFPRGELVLEEKNHEGEFRGRDTLTFQVLREGHGVVSGFMSDSDRSFGTWTFNTTTNHLHMQWPENSGSEGFPYDGTCEPVAEGCSGENPFGTFTLSRSVSTL